MYTDRQIDRILNKLKRMEEMLEPELFEKVDELSEVSSYQTEKVLDRIPETALFRKTSRGDTWEGE